MQDFLGLTCDETGEPIFLKVIPGSGYHSTLSVWVENAPSGIAVEEVVRTPLFVQGDTVVLVPGEFFLTQLIHRGNRTSYVKVYSDGSEVFDSYRMRHETIDFNPALQLEAVTVTSTDGTIAVNGYYES